MEHRGCWEARAVGIQAGPSDPEPQAPRQWRRDDRDRLPRTFIPVELLLEHTAPIASTESATTASPGARRTLTADGAPDDAVRAEAWQDRRTLFGEPDR